MGEEPVSSEFVVTSIRIPRRIWKALRALAEAQAAQGGRPSVSAVVSSLVEREAAQGGARG